MKLKDTLNMPQTDFNMKAGLPSHEPNWQKEWLENDFYNKVLEKNKDKKPFYLHDGPPYANGNIHTGHVLNKVLKDFIIRSKNMNGYYAPIVFGWDTHGLPIENALLKEMQKKAEDFDTVELRKKCEEYALKQVEMQKEQFFTLGLLADPTQDYLTLYHYYEAAQLEIFASMVDKGLIFQGKKPVYWSWSSKSALADAEIEYKDIKSPAIYVGFEMVDEKFHGAQMVIWTTTPWTMPANKGISIGENFEYDLVRVDNDKRYIVAHELLENFLEIIETKQYEIEQSFLGKELENYKVIHPLTSEQYLIMLGDHVTIDSGTGCVHTAPAHGEDDYIVGKKYNLEVESIVDENGVLNENAGKYQGLFYEDANKVITQALEDSGHLINLSFIKHAYPHDWRTKKPVFYRATQQWFCNIKPIKEDLLNSIKSVSYSNDWGQTRLYNMLDNREEWCISRQRKWGVPIPIFYAENGDAIIDTNIISHVANLFSQYGTNIWYEWSAEELLPKNFTYVGSPNGKFTKELDIMDVWFDSGSSHHAVLKKYYGIDQADLYFEGSDQYRGWFNSSLITSVAMNGKAPYKSLLSHGFVLDGKGNKMSKSLGNVIEPEAITSQRGADILRLWVACVNYQQDVNLTNELLDQVSEMYRKYRNTIRFMLGNVNDFDESKLLSFGELEQVDQYMLVKLENLTQNVINNYEKYNFTHILDDIMNYITNLLSGFYLDFIKDIIYVSEKNALRRRQIQTVLYYHLEQLITLMTPIIPHTCYEAYMTFKDDVVFFEQFKIHNEWKNYNLTNDFTLEDVYDGFLNIRDDINKELDIKRKEKIIGSSLKANVTITPSNQEVEQILRLVDSPEILCIVHELNIDNNNGSIYKSGQIDVVNANLNECARCRKVFHDDELRNFHLEDEDVELCSPCYKIVSEWK